VASTYPEDEHGEPRAATPTSAVRVPPPRRAALPDTERARTVSGPRDLAYADAEHGRQERFEDLERHLNDTADALNAAEDRREHAFRENEDARERIFTENEQRRTEEAVERQNQIWRDLEDRLNAIALPVPPPGTLPVGTEPGSPEPSGIEPEIPSVHRDDDAVSVDSMRRAAVLYADEIKEIVRLEREQIEREREAAAAERERMLADVREERARLDEEREARIRGLEEELATVKAELENERQLKITEEAERHERERMENMERDEAVRAQLGDITNLVQEQRDECARKKELMDQRWEEKMNRRGEKDNQLSGLYDMINKIIEDREAERVRLDEERIAAESKPGKLHG
jgi:hypothetical protein